ncbi:carbonic anhydrase [Haloarchaeobius amylolyticus]|uniref:carbonic anhydrase n=1 Tax=Haloarchaeobius amylolyticus TaxID=1198296 RepID=UPI00226DCAA6|nr:carbonic anhydrase [Haloarchaeobius amylolyticus]
MNETVVDLLADNLEHAREFESRFDEVQDAQFPDAVTVCCSDSRVLQDHMWGNDQPGRLFTCGNIGNRVIQRTEAGEVVAGDVLYPVAHTGTETVIVVGHTGCGAVTATYDFLAGKGGSEPAGIEHCIGILAPHLEEGVESLPDDRGRAESINSLVEYNVDQQVQFLLDSDDVPDDVDVVGVVYDFQDVYDGKRGEVHVVNVNGERRAGELCESEPALEGRIQRLWEY